MFKASWCLHLLELTIMSRNRGDLSDEMSHLPLFACLNFHTTSLSSVLFLSVLPTTATTTFSPCLQSDEWKCRQPDPPPRWSTWRATTIPLLPWRTRWWAVLFAGMTTSWVAWRSSRTSLSPLTVMPSAPLMSLNISRPAMAQKAPLSSVNGSSYYRCIKISL